MVTDPLVYICAPYRGQEALNVRRAILVAGDLRTLMMGVHNMPIVPVIPHLSHLAALVDGLTCEQAIEDDLALLSRCDALYIGVDEPEWTDGMRIEIEHASKLRIPWTRGGDVLARYLRAREKRKGAACKGMK